MRLFQLLIYMLALTIGGCLAFQHNIQFPHRSPKQLKYIEKTAESSPGPAAALTAAASSHPTLNNQGKALFKTNCASCHNKNMKDDLVGPALSGVTERWNDFPKEDLYEWIRNAQRLVEAEHPRALAIWKEWNKAVMTPFPNLTDEDIEAILFYIKETSS
ncbi:MAG: cytochrome c [Saprospiraceae bacterium]|nr:cytochrome c [Saprospiraceae bacterium]